jgi:hypothetical protein
MSVKLSPVFNGQVVDANGAPAVGYKLFTYAAGSSSKQTTYCDKDGLVPQTNPIILDSDGRTTNGPIWLTVGQTYKFVLTGPNDTDPPTSPVDTIDGVTGVNDASISVSQWQSSGATPTYVSASSFTLVGDQTSEFHPRRRLQFTVSSGTVYGYILTSSYTTLTTVTLVMDAGQSLDAGLSAVNLSILRGDHPATPSLVRFAASANIVSASTVDLTAVTGNAGHVTGTTTIAAWTMNIGQMADVIFDGILQLTHSSTTNSLPGAANITTAAGDRARLFYDGTTVYCLAYVRADGTSVVVPQATESAKGGAEIATQTETNALTDDARFVTPLKLGFGFVISLGTNGYIKFPAWLGGLIIQWYRVSMAAGSSTQSFNHPLAFPGAAYVAYTSASVAANVNGAIPRGTLDTVHIELANVSGSAAASTVHVLVIGV